MKVKIFYEDSPLKLEEKINSWLEKNTIEVIDTNFSIKSDYFYYTIRYCTILKRKLLNEKKND